jgi:hypothetical protein
MPVVPFIPLIAAGVGIGGSIASSKISSNAQKNAIQAAQVDPNAVAQRQQIEQQTAYGKQMGEIAGKLEPQYESGVNYFTDYFKKLLSDDNSTALSAISPLVRARKNQTAASLKSLDFMPRGGGTNEAISKIYDNEHSDILDLLAKTRESGRGDFMSLIGDEGSRAQNYLSGAAGTAGNAASLLGTAASRNIAVGQQAAQNSSQNSYSIGQAIGPLLLEIMNMGKNGGGGSKNAPVIWNYSKGGETQPMKG